MDKASTDRFSSPDNDSAIPRNALNRMCQSLETDDNCKHFKAFPEAYCHRYGLNREETHAVTDLDVREMLRLGADLASIGILTSAYNMDVLDVGAQQSGLSVEEFRQSLQSLDQVKRAPPR